MGRSAILLGFFIAWLAGVDASLSAPVETADGQPSGLWLVRGIRLLALAGIIMTWISVGRGFATGSRRLGFAGGVDGLSMTMFALAGVVLLSEGIEAAVYGIQPPIFFFICLPLFWVGVGVVALLGGCSSPDSKPEPAPSDPCVSDVKVRDSGPTHNGGRFADFAKVRDAAGVEHNFLPLNTSPNGDKQLGLVEGTYPGTQVNGFFKKVEVDVTTTAPCTIVSVERTRQTLAGHNIPNPQPDGNDGPPVHSVVKINGQRWVVTDAAGFLERTADLVFYKRFTVTATFQDAAGRRFTKLASYTVLVRLDGAADLMLNPPPP